MGKVFVIQITAVPNRFDDCETLMRLIAVSQECSSLRDEPWKSTKNTVLIWMNLRLARWKRISGPASNRNILEELHAGLATEITTWVGLRENNFEMTFHHNEQDSSGHRNSQLARTRSPTWNYWLMNSSTQNVNQDWDSAKSPSSSALRRSCRNPNLFKTIAQPTRNQIDPSEFGMSLRSMLAMASLSSY